MFLRWLTRVTTFTTVLLILTTKVGAQKPVGFLFDTEEKPSLDNFKCPAIEGSLVGCYNCYLCDENEITRERIDMPVIERIKLFTPNCEPTEVCCISQGSLESNRAKMNCGTENPDGYPPAVRKSSRSALLGEYPWRAWVFSTYNESKPLCAATFVADNINGFLIPASCLNGQTEKTVYIVFNPNPAKTTKLNVKTITRHEDFDGSHTNDIALITSEDMPATHRWVHPACIPSRVPAYGTVCTAVSEDNYFVDSAIGKQEVCKTNNGTAEPEANNPTLNCSISVLGDYQPQYGSGLFCLNEDGGKPMQVIQGMVLYRKYDNKIFYVGVKYYSEWIEENIQKIFSKYFRTKYHVGNTNNNQKGQTVVFLEN